MRKIKYIVAVGAVAVSLAGCTAKSSTASTVAATSTAAAAEAETEVQTASKPETDETEIADETAPENVLAGGWTKPESPELTDEVRTYFSEVFPDEGDTFYEPVALLGTQVVSGTNYKILFREIPAGTLEASETYAIGTIYVDFQKNVKILNVEETGVKTHLDEDTWITYAAATLTDDEKNAFQNAFNGMTGVSYDPISIIAENDTGYLVLCEAAVVYPDAEPYYAVVEIKKTETGALEIGEISNLEAEKNTENEG